MIFADSNLQSFHALYSNCCQFAMTPAMLREHESKLSVTQQVVFCVFIVYGCDTAGSYTKIVFCNGVEFVRIFLQIVRIFCHDLTDRSCPRLTPLEYVVKKNCCSRQALLPIASVCLLCMCTLNLIHYTLFSLTKRVTTNC